MANFKPKMKEIRICRLLSEHCTDTALCFQCASSGDLFTSSGNQQWAAKRLNAIKNVVNVFGTFMVMFDVNSASSTGQIDANHFGEVSSNWIHI